MLRNTLITGARTRAHRQRTSQNGHGPSTKGQPHRPPDPAPTQAEQLRAELAALNLSQEAEKRADQLADRLNRFQTPRNTLLRLQAKDPDRLTILWETLHTQHCIQLDVDLQRMRADYEYSMVCNENDQMKAFPLKPLGSVMTERIDLNLNRQAHWTWLEARVRATGKHLPD